MNNNIYSSPTLGDEDIENQSGAEESLQATLITANEESHDLTPSDSREQPLSTVGSRQTLQHLILAAIINPFPGVGEDLSYWADDDDTEISEFELDTENSEYGSDSSPSDTSLQGSVCELCDRRHKTIFFLNCTHGACVDCTKKLWWSKIEHEAHWPETFPCPYCRADVDRVRREQHGVSGTLLVIWILNNSSRAAVRSIRFPPGSE